MQNPLLASWTFILIGACLLAERAQGQINVLNVNQLTNGPSLNTTANWVLLSGPSAGANSSPGTSANPGSHVSILFSSSTTNLSFSSGNIYGTVYNVTNGLSYAIQGSASNTNGAPSIRLGDTNSGTATFDTNYTIDYSQPWLNPISGALNDLVFLTNNSNLEIDYTNLGSANPPPNSGGPVSLNIRNGGNFNISSNCILTINAPITLVGSRTVTLTGQGLVILAGTNTYNNKTVITAGTLRVMNPAALSPATPLSSGGSTSDSSTLDLGSPGNYAATNYTPGVIHVTASGGSGTLTITNLSPMNGTSDKLLDAGTNVTITILSAFDIAGSSPNSRNIRLPGAGTIQFLGPVTTANGALAGINKSGEGTVILSGANTYAGGTIIAAGKLQVVGPAALPTATTITTGSSQSDSTALDLASSGSYAAASLTLSGILRVTASGGAGTLTFANASGMTGNANKTLDSGTNVTVVMNAPFDVAGTSTGSRNLDLQGAGNSTFNSPVTGTSGTLLFGVIMSGPGTATFNAANTYNGDTRIDGGKLALGASGSIANSTNIILASGATFDVSAVSGFALGANQILSNRTSTAILAGNLNASAGTVSLTYASGTPSVSVTNGTLRLSASTVFSINNIGTQLAGGSYKIISTNNAGSVSGTVPAVTVGGNGAAAAASLQISSGELYLNVVSSLPATGTNIAFRVSGSTLNLSWPTSYTGWLLQSNSVNVTISSNWHTVPGSAGTNSVFITIDPASKNVFYRMLHP